MSEKERLSDVLHVRDVLYNLIIFFFRSRSPNHSNNPINILSSQLKETIIETGLEMKENNKNIIYSRLYNLLYYNFT